MISGSRQIVVIVWPNGSEERVRRSQLQNRLHAVKAQARKCGHTAQGHECHVVIAGSIRSIPTGSKFIKQETVGDSKVYQFKEITPHHESVLTAVLRSVLCESPC